ncbi:LamG domain-containing protein, partial [bacterium]|nr:LamG domain-containing protein [bacterium]
LKIVLPSLCLLFVVGLVYFFAFAEPANQLPQNQTFLNLAHQDINASTTAPTTYTSTSTHTSQADFEASGSGGFGYSATTTPDSVVGNDDLGVFRSAPIDLGLKTKLSTATFTKGGSARVFARSGSVASVSPVEVKRTIQTELGAGSGSGYFVRYDSLGNGFEINSTHSSEFGLVSLWHMNEGTGTSVADSKGTNNGTWSGTGTYWETVSPKLGAASGKFNGSNDAIGVGHSASLEPTILTVEAWIKTPGTVDYANVIAKYNPTTGLSGYCFNVSVTGVMRFDIMGASTYSTGGGNKNIKDNQWHHIVGVFTGSQIIVYTDGVAGVPTSWSTLTYTQYALYIGTSPTGLRRFSGLIDEVAIYNRALSASEIQQHYEAGSPATSTAYESDILELASSAQGDRLPIQASVPTNTTLAYKIRSGETTIPDGSWSAWTATTSVVSGLNVLDISARTGKYWQVGFNGTSNGSATWTMGGFSVVPKPSDYSNLIEIVSATSTQVLPAERYLQWLGFGADTWNVNDVSLTSKFTAIDLGKRYNIDTLALTDSDDDLYRIHYSLQDVSNYASTTSWVDVGDKTASTTLSHTFTGTNGKALRWFRFNRVNETGATSSNPQAKAFLSAQPTTALYRLWQGGDVGNGGGFMTRYGSGTTGYYTINPPSTAIGTISSANEYRICNGTIAQTKDFIIKFLRQGDNDGYKIVELSWDNHPEHWESYDGTSQTAGAVLDKNSAGYNPATLAKNTEG